MIVRIVGEGQFEITPQDMETIFAGDEDLTAALDSGDEQAFAECLEGLLSKVKASGTQVAAEEIKVSDLVFPPGGTNISEMKRLLDEEA